MFILVNFHYLIVVKIVFKEMLLVVGQFRLIAYLVLSEIEFSILSFSCFRSWLRSRLLGVARWSPVIDQVVVPVAALLLIDLVISLQLVPDSTNLFHFKRISQAHLFTLFGVPLQSFLSFFEVSALLGISRVESNIFSIVFHERMILLRFMLSGHLLHNSLDLFVLVSDSSLGALPIEVQAKFVILSLVCY
jgi:hypothetical protein